MSLFKLIFAFLFMSVLAFSSVNMLKDIQMKKSELVLTFSQKIDKKQIKNFRLSHPRRNIFDFRRTRLRNVRIGKKFPKNIRIAQFSANTVRIVLQESQVNTSKAYIPVLTSREYHIPLSKSEGLIKNSTPRKKHQAKHKRHNSKSINEIFSEVEMLNSDERLMYQLDSKESHVSSSDSLPVKYKKSNGHDLVVIDAGHGGHDSGAVGGGKKEKTLVLAIAKKTAQALKKRGYRVYMTRSSDRFLKLSQRTRIADRKGAAAFISIHANSVPKKRRRFAHGIETFFLQNTRDAKSQRIATRENAAVLKGAGSRLSKSVIVDSVLNGPKIIESNKLAISVQRRIMSNVHKQYRDVKDGGVRHAPFYVLVGASRPSILVEVGYISHKKERKRLFTSSYQKRIANGIAEGLDSYLNNRKKEIDID